jgi:hypothetical protein
MAAGRGQGTNKQPQGMVHCEELGVSGYSGQQVLVAFASCCKAVWRVVALCCFAVFQDVLHAEHAAASMVAAGCCIC